MTTTLLLLRNSENRKAICIRSTSVMIDIGLIECAVAGGHVKVLRHTIRSKWLWTDGSLYGHASVYADTPKMLKGLQDEFDLELVGFETPAGLARAISQATARLHQLVGDAVSEDIGMSISHLTETFNDLATLYTNHEA